MSASLSTVKDGISKYLKEMRQREKALQGYLNRNVLEQYRNAQRKRWMTENASEGTVWTRLNPGYAARKKKQFTAYEGRGTKMLIATNTLFKSVIGPGNGFRKLTTPRTLTLSTSVEYARHVDAARSITEFGPKTMSEIYGGIAKFVFKGILTDVADI
jgi:hypothetical protein